MKHIGARLLRDRRWRGKLKDKVQTVNKSLEEQQHKQQEVQQTVPQFQPEKKPGRLQRRTPLNRKTVKPQLRQIAEEVAERKTKTRQQEKKKAGAKTTHRVREREQTACRMNRLVIKRKLKRFRTHHRWRRDLTSHVTEERSGEVGNDIEFARQRLSSSRCVSIPTCHRTQVSQSFEEIQVSQSGTPSQWTSSQTRSQAETRRQETRQLRGRSWRSATESPWTLWHNGGSRHGHPR